MSTTQDLVTAMKAELKACGVTYADLARELDMSESSVKRIFAKGDMPLSRIDEVLRVIKMDFAELARRVADAQPLRGADARAGAAVVADRRLLLLAICCLSHWTFEQMVAPFRSPRRSASRGWSSSTGSASSSCARSTAIASRSRRASAGSRTGR